MRSAVVECALPLPRDQRVDPGPTLRRIGARGRGSLPLAPSPTGKSSPAPYGSYGKEALMSKGPGRVGRAIEAALAAEPDNAFTVEDLCDRVYVGERIEKKHRVAVIRAAKRVADRNDNIAITQSVHLGSALIFYHRYNVMSYAMAQLKGLSSYRTKDIRRLDTNWDESHLRAMIAGGIAHQHVVPGGVWWRNVEIRIAERDGDTEKVTRLKAERDIVCFKCPRCLGNVARGLVCVACLSPLHVWHPEISDTLDRDNAPMRTIPVAEISTTASGTATATGSMLWRIPPST